MSLEQGKIIACGTYDNLVSSGHDFAIASINDHVDSLEEQTAPTNTQSSQTISHDKVIVRAERKDKKQDIIVTEDKAEGVVSFASYKAYFVAGGGLKFAIIVFITLAIGTLHSPIDFVSFFWFYLSIFDIILFMKNIDSKKKIIIILFLLLLFIYLFSFPY